MADFKGGVVEQSKRFLADYAQLLRKDHPVWAPIGLLQRLRNYLVHSAVDQCSKEGREELRKIDRSCQRFDLIDDGELTLPRELCDHMHASVKEFFSVLFDSVGWMSFKQ